jgi:uncharacterized membrane protein
MFIKLFIIALPAFLLIDMVWLVLVAKKFYNEQLGFLMKPDVNLTAVIIFYLLFVGGLVTFVIAPAVEKHSWTHALIYGIFFGIVTYATYDLTNMATIRDWPLVVTIVDLVWGMVVASSVSLLTFLIYQRIWR